MKLKLCLIFLLQMLFIASCSKENGTISCVDKLPEEIRNNANTALQISVPANLNTLKVDDHVVVVVENFSDNPINVSPDKGLRFYWLQADKWILIENRVDFLSVTNQIIPRTDMDPGGMIYTGIFELPEQRDSVHMCITVEGVNNSSNSPLIVGAFSEVILNP